MAENSNKTFNFDSKFKHFFFFLTLIEIRVTYFFYIFLLFKLFDCFEWFQIIKNYSVSPTLPIFSRIVQFHPWDFTSLKNEK